MAVDRDLTGDARFVRVLPIGAIHQQLPPGTYDLLAFRAGQGVSPLTDPLLEPAMRKLARRVEIKANETTNLTLEAAPEQ